MVATICILCIISKRQSKEPEPKLPRIKIKIHNKYNAILKSYASINLNLIDIIGLPILTLTMLGAMLNTTTLAMLLIIGGIEINPGPTCNKKTQLQIITQNVRGLNELSLDTFLFLYIFFSALLHS